jgi:PIN domain nuclease of toxin-antitoxin system
VNLLLDTNILLWWLAGHSSLQAGTIKIIEEAVDVYVSAASAWEIGIKSALKKLDFRGDLETQLETNDFKPLPITVAHAIAAGRLPRHHDDPFDRMLIAQAASENLTLVTSDLRLKKYDLRIFAVKA